jgi:hypothetical protein
MCLTVQFFDTPQHSQAVSICLPPYGLTLLCWLHLGQA